MVEKLASTEIAQSRAETTIQTLGCCETAHNLNSDESEQRPHIHNGLTCRNWKPLGDGEPSSALLGVCNYGNHESPHPAWPACRNWKPLSESGAAQEVSPTEKEKRIERPKS